MNAPHSTVSPRPHPLTPLHTHLADAADAHVRARHPSVQLAHHQLVGDVAPLLPGVDGGVEGGEARDVLQPAVPPGGEVVGEAMCLGGHLQWGWLVCVRYLNSLCW